MAAFLLPLVEIDLNDKHQEKLVKMTLHDWKYSNEESHAAIWLLKSCPVLLSAGPGSWPQVQRRLVHDLGSELLQLCTAVSRFENERFQENLDYCRQQLQLPPEQLDPEPLVNAQVLIEAGYKPGPAFKEALEQIRDLQLDGKIASRDEALEMVERMLATDD